MEFIQRGVLNSMFMMRLIMEPLRELLDRKLYIGSIRFNLHQAAAATNDPCSRQTPLGIAAQNTSEDAFFRKLGQLSNPELWHSSWANTELLHFFLANIELWHLVSFE